MRGLPVTCLSRVKKCDQVTPRGTRRREDETKVIVSQTDVRGCVKLAHKLRLLGKFKWHRQQKQKTTAASFGGHPSMSCGSAAFANEVL